MSISYLARTRRAIFETQKNKVKDWVKYYGDPNNGCGEFIISKDILYNWITKKIYYKPPELKHSAISLDYIILFWKVSFFIEDGIMWFIGEVLCNKNCILLNTKDYTVKIYKTENSGPADIGESEVFETKVIKFSAPAPMLKSVIYSDDYGGTTYILNIKWSLQKHEKTAIDYTEEVYFDSYEMQIWEKKIRAVILPN